MNAHIIDPAFAHRIAMIYVTTYQNDGFKPAQDYLTRMSKGDEELRETLVPYIVEEGRNRS